MDIRDESGAWPTVPCESEEVYCHGESSPWEIEADDNHMFMFSLQEPDSLHDDVTVLSHLIRFDFMEGYTVWTHYDERVDPSGSASGLSSASTTINLEPRVPISSPTTARPACGNNDSARDYIIVEDVLREMANGVADGEAATVQEPKDIEVIEGLVSHIDEDDVVYGSPSGWKI